MSSRRGKTMKIRRIIFEHDEHTTARAVLDIIDEEVPPVSEEKLHKAMRRKLLKDIDRQINEMINGDIDEINILIKKD
jgi:hypothetical protein